MSISVVNSRDARNTETPRVDSLFPEYIRESSSNLIGFISKYYNFLNSDGAPTKEINQIIMNHDIDMVHNDYLTAIQKTIAKTIPNSTVLDKVRLYKLIVNYYNTRGSEDSVYSFFKIFFNEIIDIIYPRDYMFNTSSDQSKLSDVYKIQDSYFYQQFSYIIKSENVSTEWHDSFLKFVHPAGLQLFISLIVECIENNNWELPISDLITDESILENDYWFNIKWKELLGKHSPKFQAGWLREYKFMFLSKVLMDDYKKSYLTNTRLLYQNIYEGEKNYLCYENNHLLYEGNRISYTPAYGDYLQRGIDIDDMFACVAVYTLKTLTQSLTSSTSIFRKDYQGWLKIVDTGIISDGYLDKTLKQSMEEYTNINICRLEALSSFITISLSA